jgi:hypothetical protein
VTNPIEQMLLASSAAPRFPPNSRYHNVPTAKLPQPDGPTITYLRRRFVPTPEDLALLRLYRVQEGDRLDNVAASLLGDPEVFWRIVDGNAVLRPDRLTETVGETIRITQPGTANGLSSG